MISKLCADSVDAEVYWEVDGQRIEPNVINDRMHVLANTSLVLSYFAEDKELSQFRCLHVNRKKEENRFEPRTEVYMQVEEQVRVVGIQILPRSFRLHVSIFLSLQK